MVAVKDFNLTLDRVVAQIILLGVGWPVCGDADGMGVFWHLRYVECSPFSSPFSFFFNSFQANPVLVLARIPGPAVGEDKDGSFQFIFIEAIRPLDDGFPIWNGLLDVIGSDGVEDAPEASRLGDAPSIVAAIVTSLHLDPRGLLFFSRIHGRSCL